MFDHKSVEQSKDQTLDFAINKVSEFSYNDIKIIIQYSKQVISNPIMRNKQIIPNRSEKKHNFLTSTTKTGLLSRNDLQL